MNPKISDFGTARIFGDNESQANTKRIVGTYGYMSPEYALDGLFSVKSDVFSFGVMMLEIISGKKKTGFYQPDRALNLLGYAWDWIIDIILELDRSLLLFSQVLGEKEAIFHSQIRSDQIRSLNQIDLSCSSSQVQKRYSLDQIMPKLFGCKSIILELYCKSIILMAVNVDVPKESQPPLMHTTEERRLLDEGLKLFPSFFKLWLMLGQLEERLGNLEQAKEAYELGLKHYSSCIPLWLSLANLEEKMNGLSKARAVLTMARKKNAQNPELWLAAVKLEFENHEPERARMLLAKARERGGTERVWMKSAIVEREENSSGQQRQSCRPETWQHTILLSFQSLGVVFGCLSIAPLFVFGTIGTETIESVDRIHELFSFVFWTLTIIPLLKYTLIVLRADYAGEVGLLPNDKNTNDIMRFEEQTPSNIEVESRARRAIEKHKSSHYLMLVVASCMTVGDGILTPALSVLSASSGLRRSLADISYQFLEVWAKEREVAGLRASLNTLMSEVQRLNKLCAERKEERKEAEDSLRKMWKKIEEFDGRKSELESIYNALLKDFF
ncbi:unnamed protein product [Camellia sinensis]